MDATTACLCTSGLDYGHCCQPYHLRLQYPPSAEILMRSRFTAYALRNTEYLLETWDTRKRPAKIDFSRDHSEWTRLDIIQTKKGGPGDEKGLVEFKAYYQLNGVEHALHEISRFQRQARRWVYLDGTVKSVAKIGQPTNLGRNAACACGSGKKFKRCCGKD